MDVAPLRDRTRTTRLLILAELMGGGVPLTAVARRLGVSVQAVSAHVQRLRAAGLVGPDQRPTPEGLHALAQDAEALRRAVAELTQRLATSTTISARAAAPVRVGEVVRLAMQDGDLVAAPGTGPSTGVARNRAAPGDEVLVGQPTGVVEHEPGQVVLVALPGPAEGGVARVDRRCACMGTGAGILADRLGWPVALRFAADHAAFNAALRGLDVLLLVTGDRLAEALRTLEALNAAAGGRVALRLEPAPLGRQRAG